METLTDQQTKDLTLKANEIRQSTLRSLMSTGGSGHTAGPLGMADIFTALYFHLMKHDPARPDWPERDRLVLSNGHICPILYATMAHAGYFSVDELLTLRKLGSRLQGHPHREYLPMLESSSGPLGSGLSQAAGMALADKIDFGVKCSRTIYCLMSDGELQEGNTWEAIQLAGKYRLHNLVAIIDRNNIQIEGNTEDIMPLEPLAAKWESHNWHVQEIDGHNFNDIVGAVMRSKAVFEKPSVIIARTIPGKGVSFMERDYKWHGKPPSKEEGEKALAELESIRVAMTN